ncbi:hypothetical protein HWV62_18888 [Athelia sp. TMB]|nr:hypothetical protein HWV62_18888 [Athelia sp. TMB]
MNYPLAPTDFPSLAELSIADDYRRMAYPALQHGVLDYAHPHYDAHGAPWFIPKWQATLDPSAAFDAPLFAHATASALWNPLLPQHKSAAGTIDLLALPRLPLPELDFPPSPSDTCSSASCYSDLSPSPPPLRHVVCDLPVVAPRPLPYHSPTFLQFDLPDTTEDLSHPPYTRTAPAKRKRDAADERSATAKRHAAAPAASPYAAAQQARAARAARRQLRW